MRGYLCHIFLIEKIFTNNNISNVFWNIIGGIISGIIVYFIIEYRENRQWQNAKKKLIKLLDDTLSRALTTIRLFAGIKPPQNIQNNEQFISYIKLEFDDDCKEVENKIKTNLNVEGHKILLANIQGLREETKYLLSIFLSFKKVDSWYVDKILDLHNHINSDFWIYYTFPEVSNLEYKNDETIKKYKSCGAKQVSDFCKFVLGLKCSKKMNY